MAHTSSHTPSLGLDSDALARDYDTLSASRQFQSGRRLVADLALAPGERVLDVGCGTGLLAEHIVEQVGPTGFVLGIDPLPLRIELAKKKARANLAFETGNAYALDHLASAGFDVIVLNAVFHWLPEKSKPLASFARILRKGGRIGIGTGLRGQPNEMQKLMGQTLAEPPFDRYPRARESISYRVDEREMRDLFEAAGIEARLLEVRPTEQVHATPEAAVRYSEASSFGNLFGHLPDELKQPAREAVQCRLASLMTPQGVVVHGSRLVAIGIRR